jgi:hypothetical protein
MPEVFEETAFLVVIARNEFGDEAISVTGMFSPFLRGRYGN